IRRTEAGNTPQSGADAQEYRADPRFRVQRNLGLHVNGVRRWRNAFEFERGKGTKSFRAKRHRQLDKPALRCTRLRAQSGTNSSSGSKTGEFNGEPERRLKSVGLRNRTKSG